MEFLTSSFKVVIEKIVDYTIGVATRKVGYLIYYQKNVDNLRTEVKELNEVRDSVQQKVEAAESNVEVIGAKVQRWLISVEQITAEVQKSFEDKGQANLKTRYQLGRKAHKLALAVKDIKDKGTFQTAGYCVHIEGGTTISTKGYEDFESRKIIFDGVMKTLKDDNIRAIGVCGMGGLGKTMLVGKVATQAIEDKLFKSIVTVVVAHAPDLKKIQKDIAKELGLSFQDDETDSQKANLLRERLKKGKILLIIDDIWNKIDLEDLGISFGDDHRGSKLLLTSRFRDVLATDMDAQEIFYVGVLSNDEAKYLFSKIVGDLAENLNFQSTMVEVVKECAGLPIAITAVANALKNQNKPSVWKDALRQLKRANRTHIKGMHDKVYQSIKLSYNFLTKEAQSLFLFCSLFEEDMVIPIALLWRILVGLDFFQDVYTMEEVRNKVHTLVETLKDSCLLLEGNGSGSFKMHDVIRDVAIYIADKDKKMLTIRSSNDSEKWSNMKNLKDSIGIALFDVKFSDLPKRLEFPQLNFILLGDEGNSSAISNHFFEGVKELKVLVLFEARISLPSSLSSLHNLQTLVLLNCELEDVAIIGELKNLKALTLSGSNIKQLPIEIGQLTHLQLLDLKGCTQLEVIPPNVLSNLKRLEELYMKSSFNQWQVDGESTERNNTRVSELDYLSLLTTLCIHIPNAKILPKALLFEKLERYEILIGNDWDWGWDRESDGVDEFKFSKMVKLELDRRLQAEDGIIILLKRSEYLDLAPKEGLKNILCEVDKEGFPQLKHLYVQNSTEIQYIINLVGFQCIVFPLLEFLSLDNMKNLEKICHGHGQLAMGSFRSLKKLEVRNCDELKFVFSLTMLGCFSQLREIVIKNCKAMSAIVAKERKHEIQVNNITDDVKTNIADFSQLRSLDLQNLPNLMGLYSDVDSQLLFSEKVAFSNLEKIKIKGIHNLKMLWHNQLVLDSICKIKKLHVGRCKNLMNVFPPNMLRRLQNLEELKIKDCNSVEEVFEVRGENVDEICDKRSTQLRHLTLINLPKLKHVWTLDLGAILTFQNLRQVKVSRCKTLKSLFPVSVAKSLEQLESLHISDCELVEEIVALEEGLETMSKFVFPQITSLTLQSLPELKCFYPGKHTLEWPSLESLMIFKCDKVKIVASDELSFTERDELGDHVPVQQPLFLIEKDTFPNLKSLRLDWDDTKNQTNGRLFGEFFCKLEDLSLYGKGDKLIAFPSVYVEGLCYLKSLSVSNLFFDNEGQCAGIFERLTQLYLDKMPKLMLLWKENSEQGRALQNLKNLTVSNCSRLKNLVPSSMHFRNLKTLNVWKCHGLISLATSSTVKSLVQLKILYLSGCKRMREIVTNEGDGEAGDEICFNQLKFLYLNDLPSLRSFHLGNRTIKFPSLVILNVSGCPEMKIFSNGVLSMPKLKTVGLGEINSWSNRRKLLPEEDVNSAVKRFWEENYDPCMQQLFTEKDGFILCRLVNKDLPLTSHSIGSFMSEETSLDKRDWSRSRDLDLTDIPESFFAEEENEKQILLPPQGMVFNTEAVEMTSNSSKQTKSEIEVIEDEASQRWPEGLQVEEMQQEAISNLKPQGVFDVEAVKITESSGQMKLQIADKEMEPEADRPQEAQQFLMQVGLRLTKPPKDEDWENANEIYLMDNELSVLPENPRCPKLSALFLQRNYKLRVIPPAFFDYMPALQILNLSRTNIKSLPNSVVRLVSLKRLFLNDCHCFMVLSPKIGELKQLEVLSLEGTEIMDLPLDIKKLTNLTCLEVSFCEFQSNCRQAMQLNAVVPCGVISVLSQLEELSIDVDPGDERWDACVEDIVNEVCTLKSLYSLQFYFQRVELLSHIQRNIPSLLYFRFTVGRHVKRIMSGVPPDVEFELERWDRCLKYINGVDVPRDIKKVLQHATAFFLDRHATVKKLSNFGIQNMEKLKCLVMGECSEVQVIIDEADGYEEDDSDEIVSESYGTEKIVLGSLEYMHVYYMESLRSMWEGPGPLQLESLFCLKSLTLCTCPQLTTIFTPGLLANLCNLEELKVDDCPSIKSIVSHDTTAEHKISYFLPELKKISLHYMPELVSISNGLHIAPKLERLSFYACPNLLNPLVGEVSSQCLKKIKGETSWWEALEWSNGRPGYLDEIFVPIDIWDC